MPNVSMREIPLPRPDRIATSWLPNLVCGERYWIIQKAIQFSEFVKGERSECISPLTTTPGKQACQGWMVSRSEAIHLSDAFDFRALAPAFYPRYRGRTNKLRSKLWSESTIYKIGAVL